ncbi:response regulator [Paenibacillus sp. GD4]|jgi:two-component system, response regulator YesN|uniref:response regulator transcription factor n=1 Tax=Paenibacillus sp. GD4 TaxID=3068890 RepID=UPI002796BBF3|nr:response regulator [Paenibacillus sp. GD4]MDQ1912529.1 response regulator [Paenibacillus sp. GD4]
MYKLVLVDDEVEIRSGLSQYFPWHEVGFDIVAQFDNGRKALDYVLANPVDVILCDIMMPVMTGLEVAGELHRIGNKTKIIFLSGYKDFEFAKQALAYDVKGYIVKPTKYKELLETFSALKIELDKAKAEDPADGKREAAATFDEKVIAAIKAYVEQYYANATLEDAAALVHMNPYYVSKYFKDKTGQYFSDFVVEVKMKKAAELLMNINFKTYEVSELVGYSQAKNFTRTFKKFYGMNPRQFRNSRLPDENRDEE